MSNGLNVGKREWIRRGGWKGGERWHLRAVPGVARHFRNTTAACGTVIPRGDVVTVWTGKGLPPATERCLGCHAAYAALRTMED